MSSELRERVNVEKRSVIKNSTTRKTRFKQESKESKELLGYECPEWAQEFSEWAKVEVFKELG